MSPACMRYLLHGCSLSAVVVVLVCAALCFGFVFGDFVCFVSFVCLGKFFVCFFFILFLNV